MCGRYTLVIDRDALSRRFDATATADLPVLFERYNIAPTQRVPTVRMRAKGEGGGREVALLRWGLIPSWAKSADIGSRTVNARSETAAEKPAFRTALRTRRCLVPATGFYEWRRDAGGKVPHLIRLENARAFALAGLWERWRDPETGEVVESCSILTTQPNDVVSPLHDRMPAMLRPEAEAAWLDDSTTDPDALLPLLEPYPPGEMEAYPVRRRVNNPRHDDAACIAPAPPTPPAAPAPEEPGLFSAES